LFDCTQDDFRIGMVEGRKIYPALHVLRATSMTRDLYKPATAAALDSSQEIVNRSNLTVSITACAYVGCDDHIRHLAHAKNAILLAGISPTLLARGSPLDSGTSRASFLSWSLSRQLTAQLLGKLFHSLELLDNIFREQSTIRTVYVSMDGRRKFGEFLSIAL